jgi:hypothetical protein
MKWAVVRKIKKEWLVTFHDHKQREIFTCSFLSKAGATRCADALNACLWLVATK